MIETMLMAVILLLSVILMLTAYILLHLSARMPEQKQQQKPGHKPAASVMFTEDEKNVLDQMDKYTGGVSDETV